MPKDPEIEQQYRNTLALIKSAQNRGAKIFQKAYEDRLADVVASLTRLGYTAEDIEALRETE